MPLSPTYDFKMNYLLAGGQQWNIVFQTNWQNPAQRRPGPGPHRCFVSKSVGGSNKHAHGIGADGHHAQQESSSPSCGTVANG